MRDPRGVSRITASHDMPAIIKDNTKANDDQKKDIEVSSGRKNSTTVECVSEQEDIILVTTGDTMHSESTTTINIDLDEVENDNESKVTESDGSVKVINADIVEIERRKALNGTSGSSSNVKNDNKFSADEKNEITSEKQSELVNGIGIGCNSDGSVSDIDSNKIRSSTESLATNDDGAVESNNQRSSKATATTTKSNKRKFSTSSGDEQPPPAKK